MKRREAFDILFSYFFVSFALATVLARGSWLVSPFDFKSFQALIEPLKISLVVLGISFIAHEIAHRSLARFFGYTAYFKASYLGIAVSLIIATLFGFIFIIPGAVVIEDYVSSKRAGIIAASGPLSNLILAVVFFLLIPFPGLQTIGVVGMAVNIILAFFNLLPIAFLDGQSVYRSSKGAWAFLFVISLFAWIWVMNYLVLASPTIL